MGMRLPRGRIYSRHQQRHLIRPPRGSRSTSPPTMLMLAAITSRSASPDHGLFGLKLRGQSLMQRTSSSSGAGRPVRDASQCPAPVNPEQPPPHLGETYGSDYPGAYLPPPEAGGFCATHDCIPNFDEGNCYVVQCEDGTWSHSGGIQGACSWHGGVGGPLSGFARDQSRWVQRGRNRAPRLPLRGRPACRTLLSVVTIPRAPN
jgi:hypothetical protein